MFQTAWSTETMYNPYVDPNVVNLVYLSCPILDCATHLLNLIMNLFISGGGGAAPSYNAPKPAAAPYQPPATTAPTPSPAPVHSPPSAKQPWQPRIPTGPRKMRLMKAGEAKSMPSGGSMGRIPLCNNCHMQIR